MAASNSFCGRIDDTFGPYASSCRGGFDFTLLFEETILAILPLGILILSAPFRITYLLKREKKVVDNALIHFKLVSTLSDGFLPHMHLLIIDLDVPCGFRSPTPRPSGPLESTFSAENQLINRDKCSHRCRLNHPLRPVIR
jgi:hypothetical protein